jgi:hypothetical protein
VGPADLASDAARRNRLLTQAYPKYRYIFVLVMALWIASTLLSIEDNAPRSWASYRRALQSLFDIGDGRNTDMIPVMELLYTLVLVPLAYFVFAPICEMFFWPWLHRPVPPEPPHNFWLYAIYRIFVH